MRRVRSQKTWNWSLTWFTGLCAALISIFSRIWHETCARWRKQNFFFSCSPASSCENRDGFFLAQPVSWPDFTVKALGRSAIRNRRVVLLIWTPFLRCSGLWRRRKTGFSPSSRRRQEPELCFPFGTSGRRDRGVPHHCKHFDEWNMSAVAFPRQLISRVSCNVESIGGAINSRGRKWWNEICERIFLTKCDFLHTQVCFQVTRGFFFVLAQHAFVYQIDRHPSCIGHEGTFLNAFVLRLRRGLIASLNLFFLNLSQQAEITTSVAHLSDEHDDGHTTSTDCELERFSDIFGFEMGKILLKIQLNLAHFKELRWNCETSPHDEEFSSNFFRTQCWLEQCFASNRCFVVRWRGKHRRQAW